MGIDSEVNISDDVAPYGGKSAFTQLEHNIVAGYLITAGNKENTTNVIIDRLIYLILTMIINVSLVLFQCDFSA